MFNYRVTYTDANGELNVDFYSTKSTALVAKREFIKFLKKNNGGVLLNIELWND